MKRNAIFIVLFCLSWLIQAQILEPVKWNFEEKSSGPGTKELIFSATIETGWHLYNLRLPEGGPVPTSFVFEQVQGAELEGEIQVMSPSVDRFDPVFQMELSWFNDQARFIQKINVTDPDRFYIAGYVNYMACNDENCLPPTPAEFSFGKTTEAGTAETATNTMAALPLLDRNSDLPDEEELWTPVTEELKAMGKKGITEETSLWIIFLSGFAGGLLALLTPCVWPMIPMTVSFFLKRTKDRKKSIRDAFTYGISILVIYVALGLIITLIFGASALNSLSTNAIFNLLFFALLVLFAVSFFGAFEITLPASWTTRLDNKADTTTGLLSIFFMAFTLVLVSFSCTGPIIGTLLVQAATMGSTTGPAIGMTGFALALSIPFSLFAIFPSWLKQMPKSGGWLNSVKVVLGFLELALALKFLSVADLAYGWRLLDREVFLVLWIVIFFLLGLYLLGKLRFSHDSELHHVPVGRLFLAIISFSFALYMVPGLWGAPLKAISAFSPPLYTQDFNLYTNEVHASFNNYEEGMRYAAKVNKPVLLDFSGFGCVNCRKMEAAVWTDPEVKKLIENDYVLITLMVDDKTPLPEPVTIEENGRKRTLRTVGDRWSYLQRYKFGANAQPFYVLLTPEGKPLEGSYAFDENVDNYVRFLQNGLRQFKKETH